MAFDFGYPNGTPADCGWGSGYPHCQEEKWVPLVASNGVGFGRVHRNVVELLELLLGECIRSGYPPKNGQCWGAVCRCSHKSDGTCAEDAQGHEIPSNHSWGLAIDFNSLDNPYGSSTFKMPKWVPLLFREYGFRWLGPPINDWQHFDFAGSPKDALAMTAKARRELDPDREDDMNLEKYVDGEKKYRDRFRTKGSDPGPPPEDMDDPYAKAGWASARFAATNPKA